MRKLTAARRQSRADLTAADIVAQCDKWVPVNALVDAAIEAHRIAFGRYFRDGKAMDRGARDVSMYALRAVILARTPAADDYRKMIDYLSGLPIEAWEAWGEIPAATVRDDHLKALARGLTWMLER
jgi:hypothetical protein